MMRLAGGESAHEGRIEVHHNFAWGTVCSDGFDKEDANVVCDYLGYPGVENVYTSNNHFGTGSGPIWMSNLKCNGDEYSPFDCIQRNIGDNDCTHSQDVGVTCKSIQYIFHIV